MSPHRDGTVVYRVRFPRVSGDEPSVRGRRLFVSKFSPRERG